MHIGALEARRWAGLVFASGPDRGIGLRVGFTDADGRHRDLDDWHWMVSRVGPHAPDGSYARMEFDLSVEPSQSSRPAASTLILEWSRRNDTVALRATAMVPGRLMVIGDAPWGWRDRWQEETAADGLWCASVGGLEIAAAFSPETRPCRPPQPGRGEPARCLAVEPGDTSRLAAVAAWGAGSPATRAAGLLGDVDTWIDNARADWDRRRPRSPDDCEDLVESITDNLMWTVLLQPETGRLYTPAGRRWIFPQPRAAPDTDTPRPDARAGPPEPDDWTIFGWDTFFNALLLATVSGELAWSTLLAGLDTRYPNGNVPNWRSRRCGTPDRSQPPVGSFAALRLYRIHPDRDALATAYPGLLAWCDWWVADKDGRPRREGLTPGLLSWGSDTVLVPPPEQVPEWELGASGHQRAAWESGQDDLPLWDDVEWDRKRQVLAMSAVDLCSYRALDLACLSRIARILGDGRTARRLDAMYHRLTETMNRTLWDEAAGLYLDELPCGRSQRVAASHFLPLTAGIPSRRRARRMAGVLRDPARFWGDWVLPTISRDDPAFADQQYWRGSIWPPMNYLVLQGLRRYGFDDLASDLAWKGARMFLADRRRTGFCRENFDARTGRGCGQRFQSWGPLFALGALELTPAPRPRPPRPRRPDPR
ncbi:MAG: hypothetical protein F4106_13235 [Gemmatimonadetes bacterium]|nr:hypothetical protein [Gemmatimonadota bacterium]MXX72059.1 hypothetical protein [Gemmatimonadota bacterium]MYC92607.1 hypothetical protein [Gemmatimonadota bacterium]MYG36713.1 hypothetical protein [Gemmatimonadota bacterium]MYJ18972.1 hypothetical protein [Gemmatimonadota bacterium]